MLFPAAPYVCVYIHSLNPALAAVQSSPLSIVTDEEEREYVNNLMCIPLCKCMHCMHVVNTKEEA